MRLTDILWAGDGVGLISPAILIFVQGCGSVSQFRSSERLFRFCTGTGNGNRNAGSIAAKKVNTVCSVFRFILPDRLLTVINDDAAKLGWQWKPTLLHSGTGGS